MALTAELLDEMLEMVGAPASLADTLAALVGGDVDLGDLEGSLRRKISGTQTRYNAQHFARGITKQIDGAFDGELGGITLDQRLKVMEVVQRNAALALLAAARVVATYAMYPHAVAKAKQAGADQAELKLLRDDRLTRQNELRDAFGDVANEVAGGLR